MNITFLIGNGFDIGIGIHTQYEDFYKEYSIVTEKDNDNIKQFKKMLADRNSKESKKIIDWADFETAFGQHSADFSIERKNDYIERFEHFVSSFNVYLEMEEKSLDYSNETMIAQTMQKAVTTYMNIRAADREAIMKTYNTINSKRTYNFISFNYTHSIDNCARIFATTIKSNEARTLGKIAHIHGYVERNMIMGVNDISQITNADFAKDAEVIAEIVKPQQNVDARTMYENETISIINSSSVICIYGMSIGPTDKKWWDIISKWLAENIMRKLVILKYDKKYNERFTYSQKRFTDKIMNDFLSYSSLPNDKKEEIKSRIFVGGNHNVFEMNLRTADENNGTSRVAKGLESISSPEVQKSLKLADKSV